MSNALFHRSVSDRVHATGLTQGPWDPTAMHGGAPAALLAHEVDRVPAPVPMTIARMTVDFVRPVPIAELSIQAAVIREGKRVQLVDTTLLHDGEAVAVGRALRIRTSTPDGGVPARAPATTPHEATAADFGSMGCAYSVEASELRFAVGGFGHHGPGFAWHRLVADVVDDEPTGAVSRIVAAADYGNGVSSVMDPAKHLFINPDLSVALFAAPSNEWVGLESKTNHDGSGYGLVETVLYGEHGQIGHATQSLFIDARP